MVVACCLLAIAAGGFGVMWFDEWLTHKRTRTAFYRALSRLEVAEANNEFAIKKVLEVMALLHHLESKEIRP